MATAERTHVVHPIRWSPDGHSGKLWMPNDGKLMPGSWFTEAGLICTLCGELRKYPGALHCHFKLPGETGTLELTVWPDKNLAWAEVRSNRSGEHVLQLLSALNAGFGTAP